MMIVIEEVEEEIIIEMVVEVVEEDIKVEMMIEEIEEVIEIEDNKVKVVEIEIEGVEAEVEEHHQVMVLYILYF